MTQSIYDQHLARFIEALGLQASPKLAKALNYLAWFGVGYFVFIVVYSLFYWHFVSKLQTDFIDHVFWWLKNSGVWYLFAPFCLYFFSRQAAYRKPLTNFILLGTPMILVAVTLQISFDYAYLKDDLTGYFVLFLPRHAAIFSIICCYWLIFVMDKAVSGKANPITAIPQAPEQRAGSIQFIEVEHQGRPCRLDINSIWLIKSAGNYIELESEHGTFLKRASLKQIQLELPPQFCQCHRSAIINLQHVSAIRNQSAGHALALFNKGEPANISKRYKHLVKERLADYPIRAN
ncbi:LytR/AlgR family response regulator transcription factor [Alishewanella longhuensis]